MIGEIADYEDGTTAEGDVCVIGSGLAGIEAARQLARGDLRVVIVEGGGRDFEPEAQELTRIVSVGKPLRTPDPNGKHNPYLPPIFRGEGRLRQYGGTSNIWTGKWRRFDPLDFAARPHVPHSGWPLTLDDLLPTYRAIEDEYGFGNFEAFAACDEYGALCRAVAPAGLHPGFHFWEGETTRPTQRFRAEIESASAVTVVLGANATELVPDESGGRIAHVRCRSLTGRNLRVVAGHFVIATGGIEAPRLLLASRSRHPRGIGNDRDLVGRFFMDHPKIKGGKLWPGRNFNLIPGRAAIFPRPRFQVSFTLSPEEQARHALLNHALFLSPADLTQEERNVSAVADAWSNRDLGRLLRNGVRAAASPAAALDAVRRKVTGDRRPYKAALCVEQAPNPESRVYLGDDRDAVGMPKLVVDWRLNALDARSFRATLERLSAVLEEAHIGRLDFGPSWPALDDTTDANHPIGATRMGATPASGVVDSDCRVFGTANLFVASSSVFPTGHSVAPTLTILALARRAAARILKDTAAPAGVGRAAATSP
jgi:choline dehydrogenase-like flavoprotein